MKEFSTSFLLCFFFLSFSIFLRAANPAPFVVDTFAPCDGISQLSGTLSINNVTQNFPGCPGFVLNNGSWYVFQAESTTISIEVTPGECVGIGAQTGIQAAIYSNTGQAMDLQCACTTNPFILSATNFIPGAKYRIIFDGCAGDICDFTANVIEGSTTGVPIVASVSGPLTSCPGSSANFQVFSQQLDQYTIAWQAVEHATILSGMNSNVLSVQWDSSWAGSTAVCATLTDSCQRQITKCFNTTVIESVIPDPVGWQNLCTGQIESYKASISGDVCPSLHWFWTVSNGELLSDPFQPEASVRWPHPGAGEICMHHLLSSGDTLVKCLSVQIDSGLYARIFKGSPPVLQPLDQELALCIGDTLHLTAGLVDSLGNIAADSLMEYVWQLDSTLIEGKYLDLSFSEAGCHSITLSEKNNRICPVTFTGLRVPAAPTAMASTDHPYGSCPGQAINLIAQGKESLVSCEERLVSTPDSAMMIADNFVQNFPLLVDGFPTNATVSDAMLRSVCMNIEHSYMSDLSIELTCPTGQKAVLQNYTGIFGGSIFLGEAIDDDFPTPGIGYSYCIKDNAQDYTLLEYSLAFQPDILPAGDYKPFQPLSLLDGCPVNGLWNLTIGDNSSVDNGYLFSWGMNFGLLSTQVSTVSWSPSADMLFYSPDSIVVAPLESTSYTLNISDNNGCVAQMPVPVEVLGGAACQPCDSLQVSAGPNQILNCVDVSAPLLGSSNVTGAFMSYAWAEGAVILSSDSSTVTQSSGLYVFTATNTLTGCSASDTMEVQTDLNIPLADAGQDMTLSCNASVTLGGLASSTGPGFQAQWLGTNNFSSDSLSISVSEPGVYTLFISNTGNGCFATDNVLVLEDVEFPNLPAFSTPDTCQQNTGTAGVFVPAFIPVYSVLWNTGDTSATLSGLSAGFYSVTVSLPNCQQSFDIVVDSVACSGLNSLHLTHGDLSISPNPSAGNIVLHFDLLQSANIQADLMDIQGRLLKNILPEQRLSAGLHRIPSDLGGLPNGAYWVRIISEGQVNALKVILNN